MQTIEQWLDIANPYVGGLWFSILLLCTGLFFTIQLGFPQLRLLGRAMRELVSGGRTARGDGDINSFQALTAALSGTIGTGNLAGVALAIFLGGPAALFWMWITALLGMATKMVEVTLAHKYRIRQQDGYIAGGAMYLLERKLNMKWLAVVFAISAIIAVISTGCVIQSNSIAESIEHSFGLDKTLSGGILAALTILVIIGGIKSIVRITQVFAPSMALLFVLGSLVVIVNNYENILPSLYAIIGDVFTGSAAVGGFLGGSVVYAINKGVERGLFSNEAGMGSAPIAHATAQTEHPVDEGIIALLEPFIDTLVICTLTGLVILSSGAWAQKYQTEFELTGIRYISGEYSDARPDDQHELGRWLTGQQSNVQMFSGRLQVEEGALVVDMENPVTVIHSRSIAENMRFSMAGTAYTGDFRVSDGRMKSNRAFKVTGLSRVHSVDLTIQAFSTGLGALAPYFITLVLIMFAFSTMITWSYYGDRAVGYLIDRPLAHLIWRMVFCAAVYWGAVADTSLLWKLTVIAQILMTLPNLIAILLLRRDMRETLDEYREIRQISA